MLNKLETLIRRRKGIFVLLAIFCVLVIGVIIIGLDNLTGIILGYLATTILAGAITHKWRKIKNFLILFAASLVGIFFLSFLHEEVVYPLAILIGGITALQSYTLNVFHVIISIIIVFACAVGMLVGVAGSVILYVGRGKATLQRMLKTQNKR